MDIRADSIRSSRVTVTADEHWTCQPILRRRRDGAARSATARRSCCLRELLATVAGDVRIIVVRGGMPERMVRQVMALGGGRVEVVGPARHLAPSAARAIGLRAARRALRGLRGQRRDPGAGVARHARAQRDRSSMRGSSGPSSSSGRAITSRSTRPAGTATSNATVRSPGWSRRTATSGLRSRTWNRSGENPSSCSSSTACCSTVRGPGGARGRRPAAALPGRSSRRRARVYARQAARCGSSPPPRSRTSSRSGSPCATFRSSSVAGRIRGTWPLARRSRRSTASTILRIRTRPGCSPSSTAAMPGRRSAGSPPR